MLLRFGGQSYMIYVLLFFWWQFKLGCKLGLIGLLAQKIVLIQRYAVYTHILLPACVVWVLG